MKPAIQWPGSSDPGGHPTSTVRISEGQQRREKVIQKSDIQRVEIGTPTGLPDHTFFRFHMANHHMVAKAIEWARNEMKNGKAEAPWVNETTDEWAFVHIPEGSVFAGDDDRDTNIISITLDKACQFTGDDGDPSMWITAAAVLKRILQ